MRYRTFGKTGATVSVLGFGAMRLPMTPDEQHVDEDRAIPIIQRAYELGVNYFDTAPYYCNKESEIILGRAIKGWRDKVYISTKNPIEDASGDHWRERLEISLRKLDVDYIDFYHMWGIDWKTYEERIDIPNGPLDAARRAKEEGLIRHISFSFHDTPENLIRLVDTGNFESMTVQYNILDRVNENAITHAHKVGLGVVIMGPVGGGRLAGFSPQIRALLPDSFTSTPALALRFVLAHPGVDVALSGMSTIQMVEENVATASREDPLTADELDRMRRMLDESKALADLYCTGCGYCMPCPNDVNIPKNFEYMNYYRVYGLRDFARDAYARLGRPGEITPGLKAEACIECGECEGKCPQGIPIVEQLKEVAATLGEQANGPHG
ncbi:MAG: aldo/keto reductase [Chloroflexi bacterium]|nr:aldo/keto reductase [Chloroflexota bacterium]